MQVKQSVLHQPQGVLNLESLQSIRPQLVLVFAAVRFFESADFMDRLRGAFPDAVVMGCSTAGELTRDGTEDGVCTVTAVHFDRVTLTCGSAEVPSMADSQQAGRDVAQAIRAPDLQAVLVLGPGVDLNGSALVRGMADVLGAQIPVSGGLAGDGGAFSRTWTLSPSGVSDRCVVAVGLCGSGLRFGHGSYGGWTPFGPQRQVTRSQGNVLFELDGEPALSVYKRYLGDHAKDLPASGLLFPFAMQGVARQNCAELIRTILGVNEQDGSLVLAGEIEQGGYLRLMQASTDRLVSGAQQAAESAAADQASATSLAVLVSCIGRKLVMGDRVEEEVEAVADELGPQAVLTGFHSNGEICPSGVGQPSGLHNQTMTVTTFSEV